MANRYHLHGAPRYVYDVYGRRHDWAYRGSRVNYNELIGPDHGPGFGYRAEFIYGVAGPEPGDEDDYPGYRINVPPVPRHRGPYRGMGPRGYQRSDQRILEDLNDRLTEEPLLDAREIEVQIEQGVVKLTGFVIDGRQSYRAETAAKAIPGVKEVQNQLAIKRAS